MIRLVNGHYVDDSGKNVLGSAGGAGTGGAGGALVGAGLGAAGGGYGGMIMGAAAGVSGLISGLTYKAPKYNLDPATGKEKTARRRQKGQLDLASSEVNTAGQDLNALMPGLYEMAGITGDWEQNPAINSGGADAKAKVDRLTAKLAGAKGKNKAAIRKKLKAAQIEASRSSDSLGTATQHIVNPKFGRLGTAEDQEIEDLLTGRVMDALKTGKSNDPRLNAELAKQQAALTAGIGQRGLAGSSLGASAMAEFEQKRQESLADFARKDITEYEPMRLQQRQSLVDLAKSRMELSMLPLNSRVAMSDAHNKEAGAWGNFAEMFQSEREEKARMEFEEDKAKGGGAMSRAFGGLAQGLGAGAQTFGGGGAAAPSMDPYEYNDGNADGPGTGPSVPSPRRTFRTDMSDAWGSTKRGASRTSAYFGY